MHLSLPDPKCMQANWRLTALNALRIRPLVCLQYDYSLHKQRGRAGWTISDIFHSLCCWQEIVIQGFLFIGFPATDFLVDFGKTDKPNMPDFSLHTFLSFPTMKLYKTFCNPGWENAMKVQSRILCFAQVGFVSFMHL